LVSAQKASSELKLSQATRFGHGNEFCDLSDELLEAIAAAFPRAMERVRLPLLIVAAIVVAVVLLAARERRA
jgi:hypothetical protein